MRQASIKCKLMSNSYEYFFFSTQLRQLNLDPLLKNFFLVPQKSYKVYAFTLLRNLFIKDFLRNHHIKKFSPSCIIFRMQSITDLNGKTKLLQNTGILKHLTECFYLNLEFLIIYFSFKLVKSLNIFLFYIFLHKVFSQMSDFFLIKLA